MKCTELKKTINETKKSIGLFKVHWTKLRRQFMSWKFGSKKYSE